MPWYARYDVDELDDLGKRSKRVWACSALSQWHFCPSRQEDYVEVKRPDGTVAKVRRLHLRC